MATVKRGILSKPGLWWKHLRGRKRLFWKRERQAARRHSLANRPTWLRAANRLD